ncbi:MAG: hypothetical protein CVU13_09345 [Bacteroidetes bacterium HGW-Bacteroidetes-8]|nr:MAG: hypothetical protein CVU13_09345 [Bacteroidetes bacterium HGW-Bacteroidetes-8]
MKNFYTFAAIKSDLKKSNNIMKIKSLIAVFAIVMAVASCGTKERSLSERLSGVWSGSNTIEITMTDSVGSVVIQQLSAPIEIEYLSDSTFTAVISINDTIQIKMGGIANVTDTLATLSGSMAAKTNMDIVGEMKINADESLAFTYTGTSSEVNVIHKGTVTAVRKVK